MKKRTTSITQTPEGYLFPKEFSPFACYHKNLMRYNKKWSLNKIMLFEKMLFMSKAAIKNRNRVFFYQDTRFANELHILRGALQTAMDSILSDGLFELLELRKGSIKRYKPSIEMLIDKVESIYDFSDIKLSEFERQATINGYKIFLDLYLTTTNNESDIAELLDGKNVIEIDIIYKDRISLLKV